MTAALATAPARWAMIDSLFPPARRRMTLDEAIVAACEQLGARRMVECVVCSGEMTPRGSAVGVSGGRCRDCGSLLG